MARVCPVQVMRTSGAALLAGALIGLLLPAVSALGVLPGVPAEGAASGRAPAARSTSAPSRPNIVVVMTDDMRTDDLRFTPSVRRLIGDHGLTFENSFSPFPLCCPARASFLTGQYAHNHKVYWHDAPYGYGAFDDSRTLATSLKASGYNTGFIGKYLNGYGMARSQVTGGPSYRYVPAGWTDWRAAIQNPGVAGIHGGTYNYQDTPFNVNGKVDNRYRGKYQTNVVGDFSVAMVDRFARARKPFFMYVNYLAPHTGGPRERDDPGRVRSAAGPKREFKTPARPAWVRGRFDEVIRRGAGMPKGGGPSEKDVSDKPTFFRSKPEFNAAERRALRDITRQRAESIYVVDRQVRRLVRRLKKSGEWSDTVLMFTSDNGYYLGEHRYPFGKVRAHEPSLRVPFVVTGPGMRSGEKRYDAISTVDVSATILDLANARAPHAPDGASKVATMLQGDRGWAIPVVTEAIHTAGIKRSEGFDDARTSIGLRTPRYSYTRYRNGQVELYDLEEDPLQLQNLARASTHRAARRELHDLWWRVKDCGASECRLPMPATLRATAQETRALTRHYWRSVDRVHGW